MLVKYEQSEDHKWIEASCMEKLFKASILIPDGDKMKKEKDTLVFYLPSYIKGKKYLPKEIIEMCIALRFFFSSPKS